MTKFNDDNDALKARPGTGSAPQRVNLKEPCRRTSSVHGTKLRRTWPKEEVFS